jgi:hypothetical protein
MAWARRVEDWGFVGGVTAVKAAASRRTPKVNPRAESRVTVPQVWEDGGWRQGGNREMGGRLPTSVVPGRNVRMSGVFRA